TTSANCFCDAQEDSPSASHTAILVHHNMNRRKTISLSSFPRRNNRNCRRAQPASAAGAAGERAEYKPDAQDVTSKVKSGGGDAPRILVLAFESRGMVRHGERRRES